MECFRSFLRVIGLLEPTKVDIISELPLEVSQLILRKLDPESLLCAAQVSRKWLEVCRSDKDLRRSARHYKRSRRRGLREEIYGADLKAEERQKKFHDLKKVSRYVIPHRIDAAVVLGRIPYPCGTTRSMVRPSLDVKRTKCIRL